MGNKMKRLKNDSGFTLTEMMIVVAVIAVGAAVGAFTFRAMMPDLRLKAAVRDLKSDLNSAKLLAVRNNTLVSVAFNPAADQYIVFQDDGAGGGVDGNGVQDGTETLFKTVNMPRNVDLINSVFGAGTFAQFNSRGLSNVLAGRVSMTNTKNDFRGVSVSTVGKVQIQISTDGGANWVDVD